MKLSALTAISPIDGRYRTKTEPLADYFSEYALIRYRVKVELKYFIALFTISIPQLSDFPKEKIEALHLIYENFSLEDAQRIKDIEKVTNHDVKAVEYFLKEEFDKLGLQKWKEFIHFGLTSQDINNTSVPMSIKEALHNVLIPLIEEVENTLNTYAEEWKDIPMLAKHFLAQSAIDGHTEPKKLTSEVLVFLCRLPWPGNVRQLKNLCKYLTIMVTGRDIQLVDLPSEFLHANSNQNKLNNQANVQNKENATWQDLLRVWVNTKLKSGEHDILNEAVPEFERIMLEATLNFTGNHKQESAKLLGWGRNTLTRKIKELNIN